MIYGKLLIWVAVILVLGVCLVLISSLPKTNPSATEPNQTLQEGVIEKHSLPPLLVREQNVLHHRFTVVNPFQRLVHFSSVSHSCACSDVIISQDALMPGESLDLWIDARLDGRTGPQTFHCTLKEANGIIWEYALSVILLRSVEVSDSSVQFGLVQPGCSAEKGVIVKLHSIDRTDFPDVVGISATDPLEVSTRVIDERYEAQVWVRTIGIDVRLKPLQSAGDGSGRISVNWKDSGQVNEIQIPVGWQVRSAFILSPLRIFMDCDSRGSQPVSREITIRRRDGKPFQLRNPRCPSDAFDFTLDQPEDLTSATIQVVLYPVRARAFEFTEVVLETNIEQEKQVRIPVSTRIKDGS